jgi:hypothetical protein
MTKIIYRFLFILPFTLFFSSCVSFKNIDPYPRSTIYEIEKDTAKKPFSKILVRWRNYPLMTYNDTIGYSEEEKANMKPIEVPYEDYIKFKKKILKTFKELGLYDENKGNGTIKIDLTSYGRWTYGELTRSFLTETSFIYIIPRSLKVNYYMTIETEKDGIKKKAEEFSYIKTTFHLLLFPLYPLSTFNSSENSVLKNMIWKAAIKTYSLDKNLEIEEKKQDTISDKKEAPIINKNQDF